MRLKGNQIDPDGTLPLAALEGHGLALRMMPFSIKPPRYVDSTHDNAQDSIYAGDANRPYATLAYALTGGSASDDLTDRIPAGTVIIVKEGHTETISSAVSVTSSTANAGIWVIGEGWGSIRPTFTFATSTAAKLSINIASVVLQNLLFVNSIDDCVNPILLGAGASDCALLDIEYREDSGDEAIDIIKVTTGASRVLIDGLKVRGDVGGNSGHTAVTIQNCPGLVIRNFDLYGDFEEGAIENAVAASTEPGITIDGGRGSYIWTKAPEDLAIKVLDDTDGTLNGPIRIRLADNAANIDEAIYATSAAGAGKMQVYQTAGNIIGIVNADGESELQWPGTPSVDEA